MIGEMEVRSVICHWKAAPLTTKTKDTAYVDTYASSMDCIDDNVTTLILRNIWCRPTTPHTTHFGSCRAG